MAHRNCRLVTKLFCGQDGRLDVSLDKCFFAVTTSTHGSDETEGRCYRRQDTCTSRLWTSLRRTSPMCAAGSCQTDLALVVLWFCLGLDSGLLSTARCGRDTRQDCGHGLAAHHHPRRLGAGPPLLAQMGAWRA